MLRNFFRDAAVYALPMILVRAMGLILLPIYTRELGPGDYGFIEFVAAAAAILVLVLPLEVNQAVARMLPDSEDPARIRSLIGTSLWFTFIVFGAFGLVLVAFCHPLLRAVQLEDAYAQFAPLVSCTFLVTALLTALQVQFRFTGQARASAAVNGSVVVCNVGLVLGFAAAGKLDVRDYFLCQILAGGLGIATGVTLLHRRYGAVLASPSLASLRELLSYSLPIVVSSAGVALTASVDRLSIGHYVGLEALGLYGAGLRLAAVVGLGFYLVSTAMTPIVYRDHARAATRAMIGSIFGVSTAVALAGLGLVTFLAEPVIVLLAGRQFAGAAPFLFYLMLSAVVGNLYIFFLGMDISKHTRILGGINLGAGLLGAAACLVLVPPFGVWGAISATLLAGCSRLAAYAWHSQRRYPVDLHYGWPLLAACGLLAFNIARDLTRGGP
jgi:O-antigen/teichoic acid export membrane protein